MEEFRVTRLLHVIEMWSGRHQLKKIHPFTSQVWAEWEA